MMIEESWIIIKSYSYIHEAEIARANLESAGYQARLANAHSVALLTYLAEMGSGIELAVPEHQAEEAMALLEQDFSANLEDIDD